MFYKEQQLKNGLRIVLLPLDYMHSVLLSIFVNAGSRFEDKETSGLGHLLEHILTHSFKKELEQMAGDLEASTFQEYTTYQLFVVPEYVKEGVTILANMLQRPSFKDQRIQAEKDIIREEICSYQDAKNHNIDLHQLTSSLLWPKTNLSWSVLGEAAQVEKFTKKDVQQYWQKFYTPNRALLCIVGKFHTFQCISLVKKAFNSWQAGKVLQIDKVKSNQIKPRYRFIQSPGSQIEVRLAFPVLSYNDPRYEILNLLNTIIDLRMKKRICFEQGLVYDIYSDFTTFSDNGFLNIDFSVHPKKFIKTLRMVLALKEQRVTHYEVKQAKMINRRDLLFSLDNSQALADIFGRDRLLNCFQDPKVTLRTIKRINRHHVQKLAREFLISKRLNLIIIGPYSEKQKFAVKAFLKE